MEAHSLASVNLLAANPPQYPENPSETRQEPLVLYISRVPGTRDVILSPFKPQLKNVTGGDVASSLYYVHLELPMLDMTGPQPLREEAQGRSSDDSSVARTIARKPVPGSISSLAPEISIQGDRQPQQPQSVQGNQAPRPPSDLGVPFNFLDSSHVPPLPPRRFEAEASAAPGGPSDASSAWNPREHASAPRRKPAGAGQPSDMPQSRISMDEAARSRDQTRDQTRGRADTAGHARYSRSLSPTKTGEYSTPPFTLSLIRRDPGTGDQWNVGKISSYETNTPAGGAGAGQSTMYLSASSERRSPQHPPIDIQIETAGYAKFRGGPSSAIPPRRSMDGARPSMDTMGPGPRADGSTFSRQVSMSYSRSFGSALRSKFHQMEQAARKKAHSRNGSEASVNSFSSGEHAAGSPTSPRPNKMKPRGYTYTSPWGGRCEFRTGNGGRSLLCYHALHQGEVGAYNPLVPETSPARSTSIVVSELRFNLPGSELFPSGDVPKSDGDHRLGHFSKLIKSAMDRYEDRDEDDVLSPFDVNIGGERAGGGNHGKRAKLGKLIIYHDGLKMLDLVVAANMGLWWGTWEKSY
ncbi:oxidoreductase [Trichoderma cornu-damae]|uniref:Oxidoreductase n=1 Tax=Trichoderma cornu-damae TaxID=654480 RepID=A0A9P8TXV0_9HYPO|nr:oxidoreductase [Trichoderma cornu-damae]